MVADKSNRNIKNIRSKIDKNRGKCAELKHGNRRGYLFGIALVKIGQTAGKNQMRRRSRSRAGGDNGARFSRQNPRRSDSRHA